MKKISTLVFLTIFTCLSAMAQVVLGDIQFSIKDGQKVSPTKGKIAISFPNVTGVSDPTATNFVIAGNFGNDDSAFDGVEGSFASGITMDLVEFELAPSTNYTLTINSVKVDGTELAAEGGYTLNFKTRSAERKMSWTFTIDEATVNAIKADENAEGNETPGTGTYWSVIKADQRHYVHQKLTNEEIMLDASTPLAMTEDLTFTANADKIYVGDVVDTKYQKNIVFNANDLQIHIPDCEEGDIITFNGAKYASKPSSSKRPIIMALNGAAIAPDGIISSTGLQDSVSVPKSATNIKFEVQSPGDVSFMIGQCWLSGITIEKGQPKVARNYRVIAAYKDAEDKVVELKELVAKTEGTTGSLIKGVYYPYWLADAEGNVYTHGTKGSEFTENFDLKYNAETENADTTFVIEYKKTDYTGAVLVTEGEDLKGAVACTSANAAIRSSMGKAGYFTEDLKLVTLKPGTYKIRAVLFDANKTPSYVCTLTKGEGEENQILLSASATNWTETESDLLTITADTDITLKAGGGENQGLDAILIYASTDAPDDPSGINEVNNAAQKTGVRKILKNGQVLIVTEAGTFNVMGAQMK